MQIEVWADVVCPWCYLGTQRLRKALVESGRADDADVVIRSFQLDPSTPRQSDQTVAEYLGERFGGGPEAGREMAERVEAIAVEDGLHLHHADSPRANSLDAHRLLHLALEDGHARQARLAELLFAAYFTDARDVSDHGVLREVALAAGLDAVRVDEVLASEEYADRVDRDGREGAALGVTGVPFVVLDRRWAVSGAQPTELFRRAVDQAFAPAS